MEGIYADLREGVKLRDQLSKQLIIIEGRIENNIQRYFPEFEDVFKDWNGKAAITTLRLFPFLLDIKGMAPEEVLRKWKRFVKRGVDIKRAAKLVETAKKNVGIEIGVRFAKKELHALLDQYELYKQQLEELDQELEKLVLDIPSAQEMINIKGLGVTTVATFFTKLNGNQIN